MRITAFILACVLLSGCSSTSIPATVGKVESEVKQGVQVADESLAAFNQVIQAAAPGSSLAKNTAQATVTAQKVNGVVQNVTITVPVVATPAPATVSAPVSAGN